MTINRFELHYDRRTLRALSDAEWIQRTYGHIRDGLGILYCFYSKNEVNAVNPIRRC